MLVLRKVWLQMPRVSMPACCARRLTIAHAHCRLRRAPPSVLVLLSTVRKRGPSSSSAIPAASMYC